MNNARWLRFVVFCVWVAFEFEFEAMMAQFTDALLCISRPHPVNMINPYPRYQYSNVSTLDTLCVIGCVDQHCLLSADKPTKRTSGVWWRYPQIKVSKHQIVNIPIYSYERVYVFVCLWARLWKCKTVGERARDKKKKDKRETCIERWGVGGVGWGGGGWGWWWGVGVGAERATIIESRFSDKDCYTNIL